MSQHGSQRVSALQTEVEQLRKKVAELEGIEAECRRLRQEVRESAARFWSLETNIPGWVHQFAIHSNGTTSFPFAGSASREMFGYEPEEIMADPTLVNGLLHPDDQKELGEKIRQSAETLRPFRMVTRHIVDGEMRWYRTESRPERRPNGDIIWQGVMWDVTEQKRTEQRLLRTQFSVDKAGEAIFWVGADAELVYVNDAACNALGYTREELLSMTVFDIDPAFPQEIWTSFWRDIRNEKVRYIETMHRTKDGRVFPVEITINPMLFFGDEEYNCTYVRDITERKQAQQERENLITELERKNAELEHKNAELERFTYTVSHDLKNPLVTIKGFTGLLRRDLARGKSESIERDINQIEVAADHMFQLLEELLDLSRVGRVINPPEPVLLHEIVFEALGVMTAKVKEHELRLVIQDDMPRVWADRVRLQEVYQNLVENALKFMGDQAAPEVVIGARAEDEYVVCWVRDNGIGIPDMYQERVFTLFERLDSSIEGTGVGLALTKRIVEFHGGKIWVESDGVGKGSTFYFTLSENLLKP